MAFDTKPNLNDQKFEQFSGETLSLSGCTDIYGDFTIQDGGVFIIPSGASSGKILTSDATGIASWGALSASLTGATNGLTASSTDVCLGGELTQCDTIIDMAANRVCFCSDTDPSTPKLSVSAQGGGFSHVLAQISGNTFQVRDNCIDFSINDCAGQNSNIHLFADQFRFLMPEFSIEATDLIDMCANNCICMCSSGTTYRDLNSVLSARSGIEYAQNYCEGFTDRSLVDREYVNNAISAGSSASGENITVEVVQATHGFAVKDFIGWSGGTYNKAIADGAYDGEFIGIVSEVPDANTFKVTQAGFISGLTSLVNNTTYWLSPTTAGLISNTEPSTDGQISKAVLVANSTTTGWVVPYAGFVISSGSSAGVTAADNGLTLNGSTIELGGNLCKSTDIDTCGFDLSISNLPAQSTETDVVYVDAAGKLACGVITAGCGLYSSNSPATCTVGGISSGTVLTGQTLEYLLQEILAPYIEPTFSSFTAAITSPMEVGDTLSGSKSFGWGTTTSANVASGSIGICQVGGSLLGSGYDEGDSPQSLDIGTLTNTACCVWTWQITGCSTNNTAFNRNVTKCSVYPYFWGVETCGTRPAVDNTLVNGGTKVINSVGSCVAVTFNSSSQWTWIAIPAISASRTKWFQGAAPNCGDINVIATDKYPDECVLNISDGGGCWSTISYKVYMSGSAWTDGSTPIQFRTY